MRQTPYHREQIRRGNAVPTLIVAQQRLRHSGTSCGRDRNMPTRGERLAVVDLRDDDRRTGRPPARAAMAHRSISQRSNGACSASIHSESNPKAASTRRYAEAASSGG